MTAQNLEDSFLYSASGSASLDQLVQLLRRPMQQLVQGENAADPKDIAEVMTFVVGYALAIEQVLAQAAGRSGTLPGHSVSVRGYVEQALGGEARAASILRLNNYFKDAIVFFMKTHTGHQATIDQFAKDLAAALRPSRIEESVQPSGLLKLFGLHEGAYWREFCRQFRSLDAAGIKQLAEEESKKKP